MLKDNKKIDIAYLVIVACVIAVLIAAAFFNEKVYEKKPDAGAVKIDELEYTKVEDSNTDCGVVEKYSFILSQDIYGENSVLVYSRHQNVSIYCDNELVYSMKADDSNLFGKTPGCQWNKYSLDGNDFGKKITIVLDPVYKSAIGKKPIVLLGSEYNCFKYLVKQDGAEWLLALTTIICGIIVLFESAIWYSTKKMLKNKWVMGFLAITVGCWKFGDLRLSAFLIRNSIALSMLPLFAIILVGTPMILYSVKFFNMQEKKLWRAPVLVSIITVGISILLQVLNISDIKQTLFFNHIMLGASIVFLIYIVGEAIKKYKSGRKTRFALACILLIMVGCGMDLYSYYTDESESALRWGILCFLLYLITLMFYSVIDINQMIKTGEDAGHYKEIAYKDALTGVYSRICFREDVQRDFTEDQNWIFVTCDLNNLKMINDTLGHEAGDIYIKNGADIINGAFDDIGKCYRIGGDEFWVIIRDSSEEICRKRIEIIETDMQAVVQNEKYGNQMGIACGIAIYDKNVDRDYTETMRRADKAMYERKMQMKKD